LETSHPDIAIADIGLPDKDIELTRQNQVCPGGDRLNNTKVLILTLRDNKEAVLAALCGRDSYCMKDGFDNLLEALRVTHGGNA